MKKTKEIRRDHIEEDVHKLFEGFKSGGIRLTQEEFENRMCGDPLDMSGLDSHAAWLDRATEAERLLNNASGISGLTAKIKNEIRAFLSETAEQPEITKEK